MSWSIHMKEQLMDVVYFDEQMLKRYGDTTCKNVIMYVVSKVMKIPHKPYIFGWTKAKKCSSTT